MKKTLICFLLISCLLLGVTVGLATAGGEDPHFHELGQDLG